VEVWKTMSQQLDQVSQAAMSLTPAERAELAERIWQSVTAEEQASIERAWCQEVDRRIAQADERGAPGIPAEQVLSEIEADLRKGRE
jgi:putative addiction module component (TIGR02574 family)